MKDASFLAIRVGCAGWSIPAPSAGYFPTAGSHLERYAQRLPAVEINSSFYRPHQPSTYARWAASVPAHFQFAVKVPRAITHAHRLVNIEALLEDFLAPVGKLGERLGPLLVQLPPSLCFDARVANAFFMALRARFKGGVVCEPRHASWFTDDADRLLAAAQVARVAADPAPVPPPAIPGGWGGLVYYRLHGSPEMYASAYSDRYLELLAQTLTAAAHAAPVWCIFDNTARGAATANALHIWAHLRNAEEIRLAHA